MPVLPEYFPPIPEAAPLEPFQLLTDRKQEVAECIRAGDTYNEAAQKLDISHATVRTHLHAIYTELGVFDKASLAALDPDERPLTDESWLSLTAREKQLFRYIGAELTPAQIGYALNLSESGVRTHQANIRRKLGGLRDRVSLTNVAVPWYRQVVRLEDAAVAVQPIVYHLIKNHNIRDRGYLGTLFLVEEDGDGTLTSETAWIAQEIIDQELRVNSEGAG